MDVTIGHVFDTHHNFKPNTLQNLANSKCLKYATHYQRQRLAFAPIVANTLGQFGADILQVLWNLADHQAQNAFGLAIDSPANVASAQCSPPSTQQENDYRRLRGLKYHENRLRLLTCVFEGVTTRIIGQTFNLTCFPDRLESQGALCQIMVLWCLRMIELGMLLFVCSLMPCGRLPIGLFSAMNTHPNQNFEIWNNEYNIKNN
jgi:hypothetical protein